MSTDDRGADVMVSVCCITYNHEKFISDAIEGFLRQETNFPIEILIHDDASTDRTADIVRGYQSRHADIIRAIYQTENQYSKGTRPFPILLGMARGKYIAACEGDDYWTDPHKLQKQVDFLERNPEFAVCGHWVRNVDGQGRLLKRQVFTCEDCPEVFGVEDALHGPPVHTGSIVLRRNVLLPALQTKMDVLARLPIGDSATLLLTLSRGRGYCYREYMGMYRFHSGGVFRSKPDLLQGWDTLQFCYAIPLLLGGDMTPALRAAVDRHVRRYENNLARAIGGRLELSSLLKLLRAMRGSAMAPKGRVAAILIRVPYATVCRQAEHLRSLAARVLRGPVSVR